MASPKEPSKKASHFSSLDFLIDRRDFIIKRLRRWLFIGLLSSPIVAVFITEFRNDSNLGPSIQNKCTGAGDKDPSNWRRPTSGEVKNIALTNQGEFVDRCQLTDVLDELIWDRPTPPPLTIKPDAVSKPKLVVLFVHGWMHNGSKEDPNYKRFTELIKKLAADQTKQVLGVYVTWNASTGNTILDYFSFGHGSESPTALLNQPY